MSKFIPIPVEEVVEVVEEEVPENDVLPPRKTKEIFRMDEDESDDDEPTREIPPPPIPLKKERSKKQMEHLERMRAKSLATRQAKALKKKQEEEKKRKENAEKIVKETIQHDAFTYHLKLIYLLRMNEGWTLKKIFKNKQKYLGKVSKGYLRKYIKEYI